METGVRIEGVKEKKNYNREINFFQGKSTKEKHSGDNTVRSKTLRAREAASGGSTREEVPKEFTEPGIQRTFRSSRSNKLEINLTSSDPLDRVKEFCNQGNYVYHFNWDKFKTGIMCELEISYQIGEKKKTLTKEVRYVPGDDVKHAKKVVSAILLERIGLSFTDDTEELLSEVPSDKKLPADLTEFIAENQEKFQKFFREEKDENGEKSSQSNTSETGPSDLKNFALSALLKVTNLMKEESEGSLGLRETLIETPDYSLQNKELEERSKSWASIVAKNPKV